MGVMCRGEVCCTWVDGEYGEVMRMGVLCRRAFSSYNFASYLYICMNF